ncbi:hypothetical protein BB561_001362 [Smittium simulii]|uniref:Uncharacterized protein n=1 Tax=Smittium simulii TaxID=133385 RepID=A0A2T9YUU6_9FUNG|nr:hypothetical protein BB561_001362 [Smittium simulii]
MPPKNNQRTPVKKQAHQPEAVKQTSLNALNSPKAANQASLTSPKGANQGSSAALTSTKDINRQPLKTKSSPKKPDDVSSRTFVGFFKLIVYRTILAYVGFMLFFSCTPDSKYLVCKAKNEINSLVINPSISYLKTTDIGVKARELYNESINPYYLANIQPIVTTSNIIYKKQIKPTAVKYLNPVVLKLSDSTKKVFYFIHQKYAKSTIVKPYVDIMAQRYSLAQKQYISPNIKIINEFYSKVFTNNVIPFVNGIYLNSFKPFLKTYLHPFWNEKMKPFILVLPEKTYNFIRFYALPKFRHGAAVTLDSIEGVTINYVSPFTANTFSNLYKLYQQNLSPHIVSINQQYFEVYRLKYPVLDKITDVFGITVTFAKNLFETIKSSMLTFYCYSYEIITYKPHRILVMRRQNTIKLKANKKVLAKKTFESTEPILKENIEFLDKVKSSVFSSLNSDGSVKKILDKGSNIASEGLEFISNIFSSRFKDLSANLQGDTGSDVKKGNKAQIISNLKKDSVNNNDAKSIKNQSKTQEIKTEAKTLIKAKSNTDSDNIGIKPSHEKPNSDKKTPNTELSESNLNNNSDKEPINPAESIKVHVDVLKQQIKILKDKINKELLQEINDILNEAELITRSVSLTSETQNTVEISSTIHAALGIKDNGKSSDKTKDSTQESYSSTTGDTVNKSAALIQPSLTVSHTTNDDKSHSIESALKVKSIDALVGTDTSSEISSNKDTVLQNQITSITHESSPSDILSHDQEQKKIATNNQADTKEEYLKDENSSAENLSIQSIESAPTDKADEDIQADAPEINEHSHNSAVIEDVSDDVLVTLNFDLNNSIVTQSLVEISSDEPNAESIEKTMQLNSDLSSESLERESSDGNIEQISNVNKLSADTTNQENLPESQAHSTSAPESLISEYVKVVTNQPDESIKQSFVDLEADQTNENAKKAASDWVKGAKKSISEEIAKIKNRDNAIKNQNFEQDPEYQAIEKESDGILTETKASQLSTSEPIQNDSNQSMYNSEPVEKNAGSDEGLKFKANSGKVDILEEISKLKSDDIKIESTQDIASENTKIDKSSVTYQDTEPPKISATKKLRIKTIKKIKKKPNINTEIKLNDEL